MYTKTCCNSLTRQTERKRLYATEYNITGTFRLIIYNRTTEKQTKIALGRAWDICNGKKKLGFLYVT